MRYVAFFDLPDYQHENRSAFPSAVSVVSYMAEVLGTVEPVTVLSPARSLNPKGIYRGRRHAISDNITLKIPFSIGCRNPLIRCLVVGYTQLWLFFQLLFSVKRNESMVVYHSMSVIPCLRIIKRIKHIRLIEEVLEIYSDINPMSERKKRSEYAFFDCADGFIFATELLNQKINTGGKPYLIAPATYKVEKRLAGKYDDGDIHVIYAGTLRVSKGGAINAVYAAKFLPSRYRLHIVGYGSDSAINALKEAIQNVKQENPAAKISYDGLLAGDEFKQYLQKCHIGLSTQTPEGAYNDSSFPSKIMTYLANGLEVVSVRIPAVETSPIGQYVHYYSKASPEDIAAAIENVNLSACVDKTELLHTLHNELIQKTKQLLKGV